MEKVETRDLVMEFIGTFSLVFIGGWSVWASSIKLGVLYAALVHGAVLGIMVYIGAKISGGHYNPAVTLGLLFTGQSDLIDTALYIISQLMGSLFAGFSLKWLRPGKYEKLNLGYPHVIKEVEVTQAFFMEFLGTFFLVFSIYASAVHYKSSPEACAAIIGLTLTFAIVAFGDTTGGAFNPARTFGPSMADSHLGNKAWWIYYVATSAGGIAGAMIFKHVVGYEQADLGGMAPVHEKKDD